MAQLTGTLLLRISTNFWVFELATRGHKGDNHLHLEWAKENNNKKKKLDLSSAHFIKMFNSLRALNGCCLMLKSLVYVQSYSQQAILAVDNLSQDFVNVLFSDISIPSKFQFYYPLNWDSLFTAG